MAHFTADMIVADAMAKHPKAKEVFASFHLGGCSACTISYEETIEMVCASYGVEVEMLLETLESLMDSPQEETAPAENNS